MKKTNLEVCNDEHSYSQIYQAVDVTFSFAKEQDGSYRELFPRVLCRDYLSDCVASSKFGGQVHGVYGFECEEMIDVDRLCMSVKVVNRDSFLKGIKIIRNLERSFGKGIVPLEVLETQDIDTYIILGDKAWLKSTLTISLFTYIVRLINYNRPKNYYKIERLMAYVNKSNISGNDKNYTKYISKLNLRELLSQHDDILGSQPVSGNTDCALKASTFNYTENECEDDIDFTNSSIILYSIHNNGGLLTLAKNIERLLRGGESYIEVGGLWVGNYLEKVVDDYYPDSPFKVGDKVTSNGRDGIVLNYSKGKKTVSISKMNGDHLAASSVPESNVTFTTQLEG